MSEEPKRGLYHPQTLGLFIPQYQIAEEHTVNPFDTSYKLHCLNILSNGRVTQVRNGQQLTVAAPPNLTFDLSAGLFPWLALSKKPSKVMLAENQWFWRGGTGLYGRSDTEELNRILGRPWGSDNIWAKDVARFANEGRALFPGDAGYIYPSLLRGTYPGGHAIDQLTVLVQGLRTDPFSRRHVVNYWLPEVIKDACLPPCHFAFQCIVTEDDGLRRLNLKVELRSSDTALGLPFNIGGYALFLCLLAQITGLCRGYLTVSFGDAHIYTAGLKADGTFDKTLSHIPGIVETLKRPPLPACELWVDPGIKEIADFTDCKVFDNIKLLGYNAREEIKFVML